MKRLFRVILAIFFVFTCGLNPLAGQNAFKVIGNIPHLPFIDPASITTPEAGMLVFSSTDLKPMIFTGLTWETLCTNHITTITSLDYFLVKNGIPFLPVFTTPPAGVISSGTVYYSTINKALMVYTGSSWSKMTDLFAGTIAESSGFVAGVGVRTIKLPVLNTNPSPAGLVAGAFYINSLNKTVRYYDGTLWQDISCQAIVHTLAITSITSYTAMSGGNVTTNGGSPVTLTGICWSPVADPDTMLTSKTRIVTTGTGVGSFTSSLTGLLPQTNYHVRAYAVNSLGIVYGEDSIFTTPIQPPTIITLEANTIKSISTLSGGDITFDGGSSITKRGIIWSSLSDPLNDPSQIVTNDGSGVGYFPSTLNALLGLTAYYVRAYAVNAAGTSYGNLVVFTTPPPVVPAVNQTMSISDVTDNSAVATGLVLNNGGALVTERGICYSTDQVNYTYLPSPTVNQTDIGTFTVNLTGLLPATTYYVKGYARNSVGTSYSSETSFMTISLSSLVTMRPVFKGNFSAESGGDILNSGFSTITGYGICWSLGKNPTVDLPTKTTDVVSGDGTGIFTSTMNGLLNDTMYYVRAYAVNGAGVAYGNLDSVYTAPVTSVILTTIRPSSVTGVAASSGGTIFSTGNDILSARGVCWSTDNDPTADLVTKTTDLITGSGKGSYGSHMTGLTPGTKYYVRAYAVNSFGTAYGNLDSLVTAVKPFVNTTPPVSITNISAVSGGFVTSDGNDPVSERGVCWSQFPNPTTVDSYDTGGSGLGSFVVNLTDLLGSTKYYVRAYATNSVGTSYGNLDSLKTSSPLLGLVTTTDVTNIGGITATAKGKVINHGGALVQERGFCWNTTGNATVDGDHVACGLGTGVFTGTLSGLTPNTTYYVRAYVINSVGVGYGDDIIFSTFTIGTLTTTPASVITSMTAQSGGTITTDGGALVTASGICWNTTGTPTINDKKTISGLGIGNFIHSLDGLMGSTTYYIRAYATNSAGTAYGNEVTFTTTPPVLPTLTTVAATSDGSGLSGTSGGIITSNGGGLINTEGVVWSTTSGFLPDTVTINKTVQATSGDFTSSLINMQLGTTYYVRAYATNIAGTAYASNEVSFTTYDLPSIITVTPGSITNVTVSSGGNITSTGGAVVKQSGICWSTGSLPTVADEVLSDGPATGLFMRTIQELMGSSTYYVRAFVQTSVGLAYGQVESFTTQPPVLATIVTLQPVATSSVAATSGGNTLSHGGSLVTSRGIYWSTQPNFNPDTITLNKTAQTGYYKGTFNANMTGLIPNTVYYVKAYVVNGVGVSYGDEMSFKCPTLATLTTATATSNGPIKAVTGGLISNDGGALIGSRGVVWSANPGFNPDTVVVNRTTDGSGSGSFVSQPNGLKGNTTYYVRAYAGNMAGVSYGNIVSFTTDPAMLASLTTQGATFVYGTSAQSGGNVANNGGEPITSSGVVWSTSASFRPDTVVVNKTIQGVAGIGLFGSSLTGLAYGTTYYVVAYAVNNVGVAYGNMISFKTSDFPVLTTLPAYASSNGTQASGGGTLISNGGTPLTNQGVCWSTSPGPTTGSYAKTTNDGWSGSDFHSNLTGLSPVTKYYVRAYAVNREGTSYGNEVSFTTPAITPSITTIYATPTSTSTVATGGSITFDGGAAVTQRGVIWSTNQNFNPDTVVVNRISNGTGSGNFTSIVPNMRLSTSYYIRAYAVNSIGVSYGNQVTVTIFPTAPILNTVDITQITGASALSGGEITSDGGAPVTLKGLCWNTSTNPITSNSHTTNGEGMDAFTAMVSGLLPNTLYYVRAYAVNKIGTAYGLEKIFQTNGVPTLTGTTPATNVIATTATSGGTITDDGRTRILSHGICWSTFSNPTIGLATKTIDTTAIGLGSFIANMKGLTPNTTYYVRSYATNAVGTGYGSQIMFTTLQVMLPSLTTIHPFNVDTIKATGGGNIFDDGGMPVTVRGICWSTTPNPTIALLSKINNATGGDSIYTNTMAGLSPGTKYYVRAYATNSKGTGYGNQDSITTHAVRATVSNVFISHITQSASTDSASVITDGGAPVISRGLCWNTTGLPTIADNIIQKGTGLGSFADSLTNLIEGPTYYVRAYATNSAGIAYSPMASSFRICPSTFTVLHVAGLNGAPVTKTVTYGSVSSSLSGKAACWITQNLGADHQAISATDATDASAGWYWQFNRVQGYKHDGTTRTPSTWVSSISENSDWLPANDPCALLLGSGWRVPTLTEWSNTITNGNLSTTSGYASALKLHFAGLLSPTDGSLVQRGTNGYSRTSTQNSATDGNVTLIQGSYNGIITNPKPYAFSVRCLRDTIIISKPSVSNVSVSNMTTTTVDVTAAVTPDGGAFITARGICWNTTGNPVINDNPVSTGSGTGSFTSTLSGLTEGSTYYIRAYAINSAGINYSPIITIFKLCPQTFTVQHFQGLDGAPVDKTVVYHSVSSTLSGKAACWLTQNLGADQQASSPTDATETSAGWYWQFNRVQGYKNDGSTRTPARTWISSISEASDWLPANDPCKLLLGSGWRIPTLTEWGNVITNGNLAASSAFASVLKLHFAGLLSPADGSLVQRGTYGYSRTSTQYSATDGNVITIQANYNGIITNPKPYAFPLRCLRDTVILSVSDVLIPSGSMTATTAAGLANATSDGGSSLVSRGLCWNTTGNPTIFDQKVSTGSGIGTISETLTGLINGTTYYVRAYATNSSGATAYSPTVTVFKLCNPFTVSHTAGVNGAPVSKTVTYHPISSNISGATKCWITQNLGADQQATSVADATESSAGWYWQFNRSQGYKHDGTTRTPATAWNSAISETSDWLPVNDPCGIMLGGGWRIPTATEWGSVVASPNNWTTAADAFTSVLKIHQAGLVLDVSAQRGSYGYCWSSTQYSAANGNVLTIYGGYSAVSNSPKSYGFSVRCLRDSAFIAKPTVSDVVIPTATLTTNTALGTANVLLDGGAPITSRGLCWNTTGNPTSADNTISTGTGTGSISETLTSLIQGSKYYVRAYATNLKGTAYSPDVTSFMMCPSTFAVMHVAGLNGAPVSKTVTYHSVSTNLSGKVACWLTQNLGADSIATSLGDATDKSAGWFWQFNRPQGYKNDGTGLVPATGWVSSVNENSNWISTNDPCSLLLGSSWRIPTTAEWGNVVTNTAGLTYGSALKLHLSGMIRSGSILQRGQYGYVQGSTQNDATSRSSWYLSGATGYTACTLDKTTDAVPLRCIQDTLVITKPSVSQVIISSMTQNSATITASVTPDGGSPVTSRGFCWNTTGNPTISDNPVSMGSGLGTFNTTISSLTQSPVYYVRAYAVNSTGMSYSPVVTSFKVCASTFAVQHFAGINGAPVSKTVTYHSVSTTLSGKDACWLTQNLGADSIPTSLADATDKSAGWFWQFNRPQGYKNDGTGLIPATGWVNGISENSNWIPSNDPCNLLLGSGWRIPTLAEWGNVVANSGGLTYGSALKLHLSGMIRSGGLLQRGQYGYTGGSTQNNATSRISWYFSGLVGYTSSTLDKSTDAVPLRCLRDSFVVAMPTASQVTISSMTQTSVDITASVTPDGGSPVTSRGFCWNTTGNPVVSDNPISMGTGLGSFTTTLNGLTVGPTYFVRAYATNSNGTSYSSVVTKFIICSPQFTVQHIQGINGAPVSKTVVYHSVYSTLSGKSGCWLTQNLGADSIAASLADATDKSAGWFWQFNRPQGYKNDGSGLIPSTGWVSSINENSNWIPVNDPCNLLLGSGWRIPTTAEWGNVVANTGGLTYGSALKLHLSGMIRSGSILQRGQYGYFQGSTQNDATSRSSWYYSGLVGYTTCTLDKTTDAVPLRCLRDTIIITLPSVSDVTVPTATMTVNAAIGSANVLSDGGATLSARGLCWNTTGNPTIADNTISTGSGVGGISEMLSSLIEGPTYNVRAFATNTKGTVYSSHVTSFKICNPFMVIHVAGLNGAPVSKVVTYKSVSTNISGAPRCWLTQNLGSDQQATSATDATEPSAGWYWQFNKPQGYQFTTVQTPSTWVSTISENSDWIVANDPCKLLLGRGWTIPTYLEWSNVQGAPQNWINSSDTYNSVLKIHAAGVIKNGALIQRGITGMYWGSTQMSNANGGDLGFNASSSMVESSSKSVFANSLRCLRDTVIIDIPTVTDATIPTSTMTANSATGSATVISDGGATLSTRGLCWNTTGNPSIADNTVSTGSTAGSFSETLTGLVQGPTYYVRAYATNTKGTGYSANVSSFKICPTTFTLTHTAGVNGAPVTKTITYGSVSSMLSGAAKCWLTQNLGADHQASSVTDATEPSAGWYWQFNNPQGYQFTTVRTPATAWTGGISQNSDWLPVNDPCRLLLGTGWRLPTYNEWFNADASPRNWQTPADVFASELKLHAEGFLDTGGALNSRGANGYYWSSSQFSNTSYAYFMHFYTGYADATYQNKAFGSSVRCLCDTIVLSVSDVIIPTSTMSATTATGSAVIISDGGSPITSRGLCWNTTGNPVITDHTVSTGVSSGSFSEIIPGLIEGPTYYVRGYATNAKVTAYSQIVSSFKMCNPVTIMHTAGINGAPVTKTVTYHSVSTTISGSAKCWLTQNLGADQQASSVSDATEPSAGWYWQFNNPQGYQYTTVRAPATAWTGGISQNSDWLPVNDPCTLMLGAGWRLPTYNEWFNADGAPRNWSTPADVFASELKLHAAGYLDTGGALNVRGANGYYWASNQFSNTSYAYFMHFYSGYADATYQNKAFGSSVRCLRDTVVLQVSDVAVSTAATTATGSANVLSDGGFSLSARGLCWNTTGNPTTRDNTISTGSGVGVISETLTGLLNGITYYARAYATNINGTVYSSNVTTFKICNPITTTHIAGLEGAPVTKTVTYKLVSTNISGALKCWLAQNLGADQQATSASDATESSAGWYWQFNRSQGYKYDVATLTPGIAWNGNITESSDWLPANDPCANLLGSGWRIPTLTEWTNAQGSPQNWNTTADAFASVLKLHQAGDLLNTNGIIESSSRGSYGYFWSSTQNSSANGNYYFINTGTFRNVPKAYGFSLRCICDAAVLSVTDVLVPTSSMAGPTVNGLETVNSDDGVPINSRGLCWNTTGNPTVTDTKIIDGSTGTGVFSAILNGLVGGTTYYVRAFATNALGNGI